MSLPKLSIITPNYNYAHFIGGTIKSVIEQDYKNFEYTIVDDGSKDNSVEVILKYAEKNKDKIRFFSRSNHGLAKTLNFGFKEASGDIVGWINSDDTYCKGAFSSVMDVFAKNPNIDIVYGNYNLMSPEGKILFEHKHLKFNYATGVFKGFGNILTSNAIFWRKELFDNFGYIDENFLYDVDGEFFSRIAFKTKLYKLNIPLANYRAHDATLTSSKNEKAMVKKKEELDFEYLNSYKNLALFKWLSPEIGRKIGNLYLVQRALLRLISGHYNRRILSKIKH